ncbi:unnamed protein product [Closterium sp. NIES-53]
MASPSVLTFDAEGRVVDFEVWLDDLQLFLQCDSKDGHSQFDLTSGASTAPAADADSTVRSQWLTRDAAARLAVRSHLPSTERAHLSQHKSAKALYDAVVARYSSPTTAALSYLMLPYLFPDLAVFATVTDLITHLRTSDTRYRAALPAEFCAKNPPPPMSGVAIFDLDFDAILAAMYAVSISAEGDCYVCVSPDPGIEAAALGASESAAPGASECALSGTASAQVLHTFTPDSGASRSFFRDRTTLTPLSRPVAVSLADPSGGHVLARYSTVLPCPAAPSGSLFVHSCESASDPLHVCSDGPPLGHVYPSTGVEPVHTESPPVAASGQVAASSQVFAAASRSGPESAPCSCRLLSHQTLLWHHRLGHPSLPRLRGMASRVLVSGLPRSLPPLPPGPAPTCVSYVGVAGAETRDTGAGDTGAVDPCAGGAGGTVRPQPYFVPLLQQVLGTPSSTGLTPPLLCPPPDQSQPPLQHASPLPAPSPYTEQSSGLTEHCEPASRPVSPVRTAQRAPRSRPPPVRYTHAMALRPSSVPLRVPPPAPPESSLTEVPNPESDRTCAVSPTVSCLLATAITDPSFESAAASALVAELLDFAAACRLDYASALVAESMSASPPSVGGECALGTDVLEDRQEDFECLAAALPRFASMLIAPEGNPDAPDIPTPRSYADAITGPYSSQWQAAMDAEMASWKSTGTYMTTLQVLLHVAAQRDYELHSLDLSTPFLHSSQHEEIWLRRPPGFTGTFPVGTQWSLRRPLYSLRQAPREWHDMLRTTLAALVFAPSTADLSLFLGTDTSLPLFYILVYVEDLVFATGDIEALTLVKSELQKRHTCTDLGELRSYLGLQITWDRARRTITLTQSHMVHQVLQRFGFQFSSPQPTPLSTSHSLSAPPSDESVEPSGPYPELVGCLITLGMGLVLGGRGPIVFTGHSDASWVDDSATQRSSQGYTFSPCSGSVSWQSTHSSSVLSSSCEAEIYAGAMAAQKLRWLTYLLTHLGEQPRSPPVLYVDNKAMSALCEEHRLEHRTKHITLRYFFARKLQQRGQLRLAYVFTRANTADVFTKALPLGDHQRFITVLGLVRSLPHLLTA